MPDCPMPKIWASSSTPNESLARARSTFRRKASPLALHRAANVSHCSGIDCTRRFMGGQSSQALVP